MNRATKKSRKATTHLVEIEGLRIKLEEAQETLRAIRRGDIDGLLVQGERGNQVYTLQGADESYRTLVEAMHEGALILDEKGTVLYGNRRMAEILGRPLFEVIGASAADFVASDLRQTFSILVKDSQRGPLQQETLLRRSDQTLVPVQLSTSPAVFNSIRGICVLISDLTEHKSREADRYAEQRTAQEEIRRHATELESSNRELEAFIYSVSHDLRAPLRHIHRFSTLVQEDYANALGSEARDYLNRISLSAEQMDRLIEGLLDYSRLSRGEIVLQVVQTTAVVKDILGQLSEEVKQSGAEVTVEGRLEPVWGDLLLLSQALTNLVSNALKFVPPGRTPKVRIWTEDLGMKIRLWVEDQGIGISPKNRDNKLFRVFERLEGDRYPGTGIGLAIVKRAADRMGGTVGVESQEGKGSSFWIDLRKPSATTP